MDLLLWADANYKIVTTSDNNEENVVSICDFERSCFECQVQLIQCYKHFADNGNFEHDANFTSENLGIQLASLCKMYSLTEWMHKVDLSMMVSVDQRIFPPLHRMQMKQTGDQRVLAKQLLFKALLTAGMTDCDKMFEEFQSVTSETTMGV